MYNSLIKLAWLLLITTSPLFITGQTNIDTETSGSSNNTVPFADVLTLPANNNATMSNSSDIDIFKVNVPTSGVLVINVTGTNGNMKTRIEVLDPDNPNISEGYREANVASFDVSLEILTKTTGTYFIKITNTNSTTNPSPYNFSVSLDLDDTYEYNNGYGALTGSAIPLSYDQNIPNILEGKIRGYYRTDFSYPSVFSNLSPDVDIYKVTTNNQQGAIVMKIENAPSNMKFRIEVINSDTHTSEGQRDANVNGGSLEFEVLTRYAGTYYIRVSNLNGSNGNVDVSNSNTSSSPYILKLWLDTLGNEFNNTPNSLSAIDPLPLSHDQSSPNILQGKIRGYYRTVFDYPSILGNLSPDVDIYKITTNDQQGVIVMKIENSSSNMKFRIEAINSDTNTSEGQKDANVNGDSLRFELLTRYAGIYYIKVSNLNGSNGNVDESNSNTSSQPYTLKLWLDTLGNEFNNTPSTASVVHFGESLYGKIRGHYRTSFDYPSIFGNLSPDVDYYKMDTCGTFQYAKVFDAPQNMRLKLTAYAANATTVIGSKTAAFNGDTLRLNANEVSGIPKFFKVEAVNTGGNHYYNNTSPYTYTLYLGYSPYADITSAFDNVCEGVPTNFTAASNIVNNWQWSFGANAAPTNSNEQNPSGVVFNSEGEHWVVLNSNGCSADTLIVNIIPATSMPSVNVNGTVLTSSSLQGNQWYFNDHLIVGAINQTYTATENGTYSVCVLSSETCGEPCSESVAINTIDIEESTNTHFNIYPNPSSGLFTIETDEQGTNQYYVYDVMGKLVLSGIDASQRFTLYLSHLPDGSYMLRLNDSTQLLSKMK